MRLMVRHGRCSSWRCFIDLGRPLLAQPGEAQIVGEALAVLGLGIDVVAERFAGVGQDVVVALLGTLLLLGLSG